MKIATTVKMGGSGNTRVAGIKKKKDALRKFPV